MSKWISVSERLPENDVLVAVRHEDGTCGLDACEDGSWVNYEAVVELDGKLYILKITEVT